MALIIFNIVVKYKKIKFLNKIKIYNFYIWSNRIWCYQFVHITIPLWALSISPLRSWTWCLLSHLLCGDSPTLSPCQPQPVAQSRPVSSYLFSKSTSLQVKSSFPFPSSQFPLPIESDPISLHSCKFPLLLPRGRSPPDLCAPGGAHRPGATRDAAVRGGRLASSLRGVVARPRWQSARHIWRQLQDRHAQRWRQGEQSRRRPWRQPLHITSAIIRN